MTRQRQRDKRWLEQAERAREEAEQQTPAPKSTGIRVPGAPTSLEAIFGKRTNKRA